MDSGYRTRIEEFLSVSLPVDFDYNPIRSIKLLDKVRMESLMLERAPFFFIEKAVALLNADSACYSVIGEALISRERTAGHFPDRPIVPLIELCKSIAQTGMVLAAFYGDQTKIPIAISAGKSKATAKSLIDAPATILIRASLTRFRSPLNVVNGTTYLVEADRSLAEIGRLDDVTYTLIDRDEALGKRTTLALASQ